jgi:hypothetical protein
MNQNPYKYRGPLDPVKDEPVCIPRSEDVRKVIEGINKGDYWAILGPRQIGKTTFLRLVQKEFERDGLPNPYFIYFDFGVSPANEKKFYRRLMNRFLEEITSDLDKGIIKRLTNDSTALGFFEFLEKFKSKDDTSKIILLFDEVGNRPFIKEFLLVWRKVYIERYHNQNLNRYAVIAAGSVDLIALTIGPTSPFNVAETLYLKDFSDAESERLIVNPMKRLKIEMDTEAIKELISQVSGHPQMLQHLCHILVGMTGDQKKTITEVDVNNAIETLLKENSALDTLRQDIKNDRTLENLIKEVLEGKKKKYFRYKKFSIYGAGAIVDNGNLCTIRNRVYEEFLKHIVNNNNNNGKKPYIFICYSRKDEEEKELLADHLRVLEFQEVLSVWDDSKIKPGEPWYNEIMENLNKADIALFLISSNSLTSDFIKNKEIPKLLRRKKEKGLIFFPILVRPCPWKSVKWLADMGIRPKNCTPISKGNKYEQDERCVEIVNEIRSILESSQRETKEA